MARVLLGLFFAGLFFMTIVINVSARRRRNVCKFYKVTNTCMGKPLRKGGIGHFRPKIDRCELAGGKCMVFNGRKRTRCICRTGGYRVV